MVGQRICWPLELYTPVQSSPASLPFPSRPFDLHLPMSSAPEVDPTKDEKSNDLKDPVVREKYSKAGEIANGALALAMSLCKAGAKIVDITAAADKFINEQAGKHYKDKKVEKGVAFPTCVSVNNIVGHFSPLNSDSTALKEGDLIKVDLGVHIDGYIAVAAHTFSLAAPVSGKVADLVHAVHTAVDACQRMIKAGGSNSAVTEIIGKVCAEYKVNAVQGVLSHQLKRFIIDGDKVIINRFDPEHKVEEVKFETNEVYAVDIVFSTGDVSRFTISASILSHPFDIFCCCVCVFSADEKQWNFLRGFTGPISVTIILLLCEPTEESHTHTRAHNHVNMFSFLSAPDSDPFLLFVFLVCSGQAQGRR